MRDSGLPTQCSVSPRETRPGTAAVAASIGLVTVHPDRIVRESLSAALAQQGGFQVVDSTDGSDAGSLIETVRSRRPDVVILDSVLARRYGAEAITELKSAAAGVRVLVTGVPDRDEDIVAVIELGATGYETRDASLRRLTSNIRALMNGQTICCSRVVSRIVSRTVRQHGSSTDLPAGTQPDGARLTRRELQVIALIDAGLPNKEIARRLSIELQTVKNHVHNILEKLQVHRRIDAAWHARARGLLPRHGTGFRA